jgi:N-acetylneuraminate synthase
MQAVRIGGREVGLGHPCYVVAELGINHNGDELLAMQLIQAAREAGANAVKFQKRTIEKVYLPEDLVRPRESPFGKTNGDLKRALEFGFMEYTRISEFCEELHVPWFASCWDELSVDVVASFDPPALKIASACLTDDRLLKYHRKMGKPIILSTGMSSIRQIDHAVEVLGTSDLILLHCVSTYPADKHELNLRAILFLRERYKVPIGYSGHEVGICPSVAAVTLGACMVERHITLNRAMYGSDQAASMEPLGFAKMVRDIRSVEAALGDGIKRVLESEKPIMKKLRRNAG